MLNTIQTCFEVGPNSRTENGFDFFCKRYLYMWIPQQRHLRPGTQNLLKVQQKKLWEHKRCWGRHPPKMRDLEWTTQPRTIVRGCVVRLRVHCSFAIAVFVCGCSVHSSLCCSFAMVDYQRRLTFKTANLPYVFRIVYDCFRIVFGSFSARFGPFSHRFA